MTQYPDHKACIFFGFCDKTYQAKIVDVYDGDTVTALFDPFPDSNYSNFYKFKIRMNSYNSAEIKPPKNIENREKIIELAHNSRNKLRELILNKEVKLVCHNFDKYGRILGDIYDGELHINQYMIDNGYGKPYNGIGEKEF